MSKKVIIAVVLILIVVPWAATAVLSRCEDSWCQIFNWQKNETSELNKFESKEYGIKFNYPKYYFIETKIVSDVEGSLGKHFSIILTEDTAENKELREGTGGVPREGPTAVTFDIYENPNEVSVEEWVKQNPNSTFKLSNGTFEEKIVAGRRALFYRWSGLYEADNLALEHRHYIVSMYVTWLTPDDQIRKDFYRIIEMLELE